MRRVHIDWSIPCWACKNLFDPNVDLKAPDAGVHEENGIPKDAVVLHAVMPTGSEFITIIISVKYVIKL